MATDLATRPQQATAVENNGMTVRQEHSRELSQTSAEAAQRYEIESSIIIAKKFPRNEQSAFGTLMRSCQRASFANEVTYRFPRGDKQVEGPSVYLAREAARIWGNFRFGFDIVADTETTRHIRGWAWDVETNSKASYDDYLEKSIQRKDKATGKTNWVVPDERDLRELTNKRGAICVRNAIFSLIPADLVEDAISEAKKHLVENASQNIEEARKAIIKAFGGIGVSVDELERYLTHPLTTTTASEVAELRQIWKSISDGVSNWAEYAPAVPKAAGTVTAESLTNPSGSVIPPAEKRPAGKTSPPKQTAEQPGPQQTEEQKQPEPQKRLSQFEKWMGQISGAQSEGQLEFLSGEFSNAREIGEITAEECAKLDNAVTVRYEQLHG